MLRRVLGAPAQPWSRYVAVGDSTSEGLDDPHPDGSGYRGWTDRLAERLAELNPHLLYANLAVRGKLARQVREEQLEPALALAPDLATVVAGISSGDGRTAKRPEPATVIPSPPDQES
ncbi:MAG: putative GDSL-like lipase [Conexibacter sp.]|nr:putative GDSL-like lipase [Conexibacter sp.]